jgi:hypothetical protein
MWAEFALYETDSITVLGLGDVGIASECYEATLV